MKKKNAVFFQAGMMALCVIALSFTLLAAPAFSAPSIVQEFYIPLPEAQAQSVLRVLYTSVGATLDSTTSVVATGNGTIITVDQWEDGYEVDFNIPTQSTTLIFGDNNPANGNASAYCGGTCTGDVVNAGTVLALRNNVPLPRNPTNILFDGRDRIGATKALAVSRAMWATAPGSVLSVGVVVPSTRDYGTSFVVPVGQNVSANSMFEHAALMVIAERDGTTVTIDRDGTGPAAATIHLLNQGESLLLNGSATAPINAGATVSATRPVMVNLTTGDIVANYESRSYTLFSDSQLSDSYYTPIGTAADGDDTYVFLHNPTNAPLTINYETLTGSGTIGPIAAHSTAAYLMPQNSGAHFYTSDTPFAAVATVGAEPTANNVHDWGFTLLPESYLTTQAVVGWGPGSSDLSVNGSPVWVTPAAATDIYVDYDGNPATGSLTDPNGKQYDRLLSNIQPFESVRVFDPDKNQTGMKLYTLDGTLLSAAWGQDPASAGAGNPYIDVGSPVLPFPVPILTKTVTLFNDGDSDGLADVGDTLEYTITIDNAGILVLGNLIVLDGPPATVAFVSGSTTYNGSAVLDDTTGKTLFPLDELGFSIPLIIPGGSSVFVYHANVITPAASYANSVSLDGGGDILIDDTEIPGDPPPGVTACSLDFTDNGGTAVEAYQIGDDLYLTVADNDQNDNTGSPQTVTVTVTNPGTGDSETLTLTETGNDTGIFRNTTGLLVSGTTGAGIYVRTGDILQAEYIDPPGVPGPTNPDDTATDTCDDTAAISPDTETKPLYLADDADGDGDYTGGLTRVEGISTVSTQTLGGTVFSSITEVSTDFNQNADTNSLTISHDPGSGPNRLLLVSVAVGARTTTGDPPTITGVTYGGTAMTLVGSRNSGTGDTNGTGYDARSYIYRLIAPADGPLNVVITLSAAGSIAAGATTFTGVDQATPLGAYFSNAGTTGNASVTLASASNELVFGTVAHDEAPTISTPAKQDELWNHENPATLSGAASTEPGAASVTHSYTAAPNTQDWAISAVSIKPAITANPTTATFTQTPSLCSALSLLAGGLVSVKSYYTGTSTITQVGAPVSSNNNNDNNHSFNYDSGSTGANRVLMVGISYRNEDSETVSSVTYNGVAMAQVGTAEVDTGGNPDGRIYIYSLVAPATGSHPLAVSWSSALDNGAVVGAVTYAGVRQTTPTSTFAWANGTSTTPSVPVSSAANNLVFGVVGGRTDGVNYAVTGGGSQLWTARPVNGETAGSGQSKTGAAPNVNLTWSGSNDDWVAGGVSLVPSDADVTATLKYGATTFFTDAAAAPGTDANGTYLEWSAALGSAVTIPSGSAIVLDVTNNLGAGNSFQLDYDSASKPSVISLPVTTVININSLAVYDAPYPAGVEINSGSNGQTVYIRTAVSDPFCADDITSLDLVVTDPSSGTAVSVTLDDTDVVTSSGPGKTYEYAWTTPVLTGAYQIAVTAHEGYETGPNAVTATASATLTLANTGSPGTVEFIDSLGNSMATYDPDEDVCLRVTDLDENTTAGQQQITVTLTSSGPPVDTETVTLSETENPVGSGVYSTGIFTACIPADSLNTGESGDNELYAPQGASLSVTYTDNDHPTDTSSDTAFLTTTGNNITITKLKMEPADSVAVAGESVVFDLVVTNTGTTALSNVVVTDTYPACLTFDSASPAQTSHMSPGLTWNLGALSVGASVTITVNFTAGPTTCPSGLNNTANVDSNETPLASAGPVSITVTQPALTVAKNLTSATPVSIGGAVRYDILITNTGDTAIDTLPLEDLYSTACYTFVSATTPPDAVGGGRLLWNDVTGAGTLAPGGTFSVTVFLTAAGSCAPANNSAVVAYAVDANGDPVPPVSSDDFVTINAATVSGRVYNDVNLYGILDGGDTGLSGVILYLYNDTDNDGAPDGLPIAVTTTLADGSYEFLGLGLGDYVIVQSDLTGYVSTGDQDGGNFNQIAIKVASLTPDLTNYYFLDRMTPFTLSKTASSSTFDAAGDVITYTFTVTNTSSTDTITNLAVVDPMFDPGICTAPACVAPSCLATTLAPGAFTTYTATYTITAADMAAGSVTNTATVTGLVSGVPVSSMPDSASVYRATMTIDKDAATPVVTPDGTVTYTIAATNTGGMALTNLQVTDTIPFKVGQYSVTSVSAPGFTVNVAYTGQAPNINLLSGTDTLAAGATATITITLKLTTAAGEIYHNSATATTTQTGAVTDDGTLPTSTDDDVTVTVAPVIDLDVDNSGGTLVYDYAAAYTGNGPAVGVTDSADAAILDPDDTDMTVLTLTAAGIVNGVNEIFTIGGNPFPQNADLTANVTVGGTKFHVVYDNGLGTFTITNNAGGNMPVTDMNALIRAITYANTSENPTAGNRTLSFVTNDGTNASNTATSTITVIPVNDLPVITLDADNSGGGANNGNYETSFTTGGGALSITDAADATISDMDDTAMATLTLTAGGIMDGANEIFTIGGTAFPQNANADTTVVAGGTTFHVVYTAATGVFAITNNAGGDMPLADMNALIRGITYQNTAAVPTGGNRTLDFVTNDGTSDSNTVRATVTVIPNASGVTGVVDIAETTPSGQPVTVTVTDADLNLNPNVAETVQVTVVSSTGESETITLMETGLDTGVFTAELPTSNDPATNGNDSGTIYTQADDILTVTYKDELDADGNLDSPRTNQGTITATGTIDAVEDTGAVVNGVLGGVSVANVLANDTLNGDPVFLEDVILTQTGPAIPGVTQNTATGAVIVDTDTAAGTYILTYQICEKPPGTSCDTAEVTVTVTGPAIIANDDTFTVNSATGALTTSIFNNDTLNGLHFTPDDVIFTPGPLPGGFLINSDGTVYVPPNTLAVPYIVTYEICDNANPTVCDTATVTITVTATPVSSVAGTVYNDLLGDGDRDTNDPGIGGVTVLLYDSTGNTLLWSTVTAPDGTYVFAGLDDVGYVVKEVDPSGYISINPISNEATVTVIAGATSLADFGDQQVIKTARRAIKFENTVCTACSTGCSDPDDHYVTIDHNSNLNLGDTGTIEAWIQATSCTPTDAGAGIIIKGDSDFAYGFGFAGDAVFDNTPLERSAQNIGFSLYDSGTNTKYTAVAKGTTLIPGKWYHVACVWDATDTSPYMTVFINGMEDTIAHTSIPPAVDFSLRTNGDGLTIGRQNITDVQYYGVVEEYRLWNVARDVDDIRDYMCKSLPVGSSAPAELVCYLQYNEDDDSYVINGVDSTQGDIFNAFHVCSEAPVGDESVHDYVDDGSYLVTDTAAGGDIFTAENDLGTWSAAEKSGIQLYRVDNAPEPANGPLGTKLFGSRGYWGVFITGGDEPTYSVEYQYDDAGVGDESGLDVMYRHQGCAPWMKLDAISDNIPPVTPDTLVMTGLEGTEFILGKNVDPRNAIDFDGTDDFVAVADHASLDITATGTLEAWIYIDNHNVGSGIVHKGDNAALTDEAYGLTLGAGGTIVFTVRDADGALGFDSITSATPLNPDTWYHVAGVWDDAVTNSMQLYINGILDPNSAGAVARTARNTAGGLNIGSQFTGGGAPFDGYIDEVRVWSAALSQAQIQANMCRKLPILPPAIAGLAGYWRFDEEPDVPALLPVCPDYSGNGRAGAMAGFTTPAAYPVETARIPSSAPIGDYSVYNYAATPDATLNPTATGGSFRATATAAWGSHGIHAYRIDEAPLYGPDLWVAPDHPVPPYGYKTPNGLTPPAGPPVWSSIDYYRYFGVFVTDPAAGLTYNVVYTYTTNPMKPDDENVVGLARREAYSDRSWADSLAALNTAAETLTLTDNQSIAPNLPLTGAKQNPEYIFGGKDAPLAITLASFTATAADGCVDIKWETATEINTAGFHVWQSENPLTGFVRVTSSLIASTSEMETMGAKYRFQDCGVDFTGGKTYYYMIEEVEIDGNGTENIQGPIGPVSENIAAAQNTGGENNGKCFIGTLWE